MGIPASFPALAASTAILDLPFQLSTSARKQVNADRLPPLTTAALAGTTSPPQPQKTPQLSPIKLKSKRFRT